MLLAVRAIETLLGQFVLRTDHDGAASRDSSAKKEERGLRGAAESDGGLVGPVVEGEEKLVFGGIRLGIRVGGCGYNSYGEMEDEKEEL